MALIVCPECGKQISDKASVCIHCGFPLASIESTRTEEQDFYCIVLKEVRTRGDAYYDKFLPLLKLFPDTYKDYLFKTLPCTIGTGLTKENAEWLQHEFSTVRATVDIRIDDSCTEPNVKVNKYVEEGRSGLVHCPRCGSTAVTTGQRGFSIVTGPIGSSKTTNRCSKCGRKWYPK